MILCSKCGKENLPTSKFCQKCGTLLSPASPQPSLAANLVTSCPKCGTKTPPTSEFCHKCGTPLTPASPQPPPSVILVTSCPKCGTKTPPTSEFCHKCGTPLTAESSEPQPRKAQHATLLAKKEAEVVADEKARQKADQKGENVIKQNEGAAVLAREVAPETVSQPRDAAKKPISLHSSLVLKLVLGFSAVAVIAVLFWFGLSLIQKDTSNTNNSADLKAANKAVAGAATAIQNKDVNAVKSLMSSRVLSGVKGEPNLTTPQAASMAEGLRNAKMVKAAEGAFLYEMTVNGETISFLVIKEGGAWKISD